jgi:hypothetical protein
LYAVLKICRVKKLAMIAAADAKHQKGGRHKAEGSREARHSPTAFFISTPDEAGT